MRDRREALIGGMVLISIALCSPLAACPINDPPVAIVDPSPAFWPLDGFGHEPQFGVCGGRSYDPDNGPPYCCDRGITNHSWSKYATCGSATIVGYQGPNHQCVLVDFTCIGRHYLWLTVTDDDYPPAESDAAQCNVWVFDMNLGLSNNLIGIGGTATLTLSHSPGNLPGYEKLSVNAGGVVEVWDGSTAVISGSDVQETWSLSRWNPPTVTVKGSSAGQAALKLEFTPDGTTIPCPDYNGDSVSITVVEVYEIVEAGTGDPGPLYIVCPDDTIQLQAVPLPDGASWPSGEPHWELVSGPGSVTITPSSGSGTVTVSGFTPQGEYTVKATCGIGDIGDTITIITPPPDFVWEIFEPGFACPPREGESNQKCKYDDCGNRLAVYCDNSNSGGFEAFSWWYLPVGATPRGTEVGICVWVGGQNSFEYKVTDKTNYGKERFLETHHATQNDAQGVDSSGEGCNGYWCWRVERYDCVNESGLDEGVWWRRRSWGPGTTEYQGVECPGPGGGNGVHPCYPN